MNKNFLQSKMAFYGDTNKKISEYLGITTVSFTNKIKGKTQFNQNEIAKIKNKYELNPQEINDIFFAD